VRLGVGSIGLRPQKTQEAPLAEQRIQDPVDLLVLGSLRWMHARVRHCLLLASPPRDVRRDWCATRQCV
jgi:hypothetical protein